MVRVMSTTTYVLIVARSAEDGLIWLVDYRGHQAARSYHPGGVNVLFADGSGRFVSNGISMATWQAIGTRAAGDLPGNDL